MHEQIGAKEGSSPDYEAGCMLAGYDTAEQGRSACDAHRAPEGLPAGEISNESISEAAEDESEHDSIKDQYDLDMLAEDHTNEDSAHKGHGQADPDVGACAHPAHSRAEEDRGLEEGGCTQSCSNDGEVAIAEQAEEWPNDQEEDRNDKRILGEPSDQRRGCDEDATSIVLDCHRWVARVTIVGGFDVGSALSSDCLVAHDDRSEGVGLVAVAHFLRIACY